MCEFLPLARVVVVGMVLLYLPITAFVSGYISTILLFAATFFLSDGSFFLFRANFFLSEPIFFLSLSLIFGSQLPTSADHLSADADGEYWNSWG
jgi:hypothetical protein